MKLDVKFAETTQEFAPSFDEKNEFFSPDYEGVHIIRGKDGITPHIGENGNWWIGDEDTGVPAVGGGTANAPKIGEVTLLADAWVGENNLYSQIVSIDGVTENSQVDLTPDVEQLATFYEKDITFVTENEDGVVTVFVIGQKPTNDYTIQVTITEVSV